LTHGRPRACNRSDVISHAARNEPFIETSASRARRKRGGLALTACAARKSHCGPRAVSPGSPSRPERPAHSLGLIHSSLCGSR
jgi:hypothetical protein